MIFLTSARRQPPTTHWTYGGLPSDTDLGHDELSSLCADGFRRSEPLSGPVASPRYRIRRVAGRNRDATEFQATERHLRWHARRVSAPRHDDLQDVKMCPVNSSFTSRCGALIPVVFRRPMSTGGHADTAAGVAGVATGGAHGPERSTAPTPTATASRTAADSPVSCAWRCSSTPRTPSPPTQRSHCHCPTLDSHAVSTARQWNWDTKSSDRRARGSPATATTTPSRHTIA